MRPVRRAGAQWAGSFSAESQNRPDPATRSVLQPPGGVRKIEAGYCVCQCEAEAEVEAVSSIERFTR